jgi:hypothetical protein
MILCADACGKDLIEFVMEVKSEMEEVNAQEKSSKAIHMADNQNITVFAKAKKAEAKSKNDFAFVPKKYKCAFCSFTTESLKSLNGHCVGSPTETPQFKISTLKHSSLKLPHARPTAKSKCRG